MRILHTTRSIVSGSTPLAIIAGGSFVPNDLDIYVPASQEQALLTLLETYFDFHLDAAIPSHKLYESNNALKTVQWLTAGDKSKKINVMICEGECAILPVFSFHSTIVMNFISSYGIYCAYPELTVAKRGISTSKYLTDPPFSQERHCFAKYRDRGYIITQKIDDHLQNNRHTCFEHPSCPLAIRSLYDGVGAFVRFANPSTIHESKGDFIYDSKHSALWSLGGQTCIQTGFYHQRLANSFELKSTDIRQVCCSHP
ncbi:hypothetical protein B0H11DRAFT_1724011 [Mycena galericulata]|nr:hypothetical protein B0H11DRAFT_1724011 [Mycena galericulata]